MTDSEPNDEKASPQDAPGSPIDQGAATVVSPKIGDGPIFLDVGKLDPVAWGKARVFGRRMAEALSDPGAMVGGVVEGKDYRSDMEPESPAQDPSRAVTSLPLPEPEAPPLPGRSMAEVMALAGQLSADAARSPRGPKVRKIGRRARKKAKRRTEKLTRRKNRR